MNQKREQPQQQTRAGQQTSQDSDPAAQGEELAERARELQTEHASMLDIVPVQNRYQGALATLVETKHEQAAQLEERLENLIGQQESKLQQCRSQQPGFVALPGARANWQQQMQQQESTLLRLQGRLEAVRDIKDGMGLHGPRIEEIAARRLRALDPVLASEWDELQEAERLNLAHQRKQGRRTSGMANILAISTRCH